MASDNKVSSFFLLILIGLSIYYLLNSEGFSPLNKLSNIIQENFNDNSEENSLDNYNDSQNISSNYNNYQNASDYRDSQMYNDSSNLSSGYNESLPSHTESLPSHNESLPMYNESLPGYNNSYPNNTHNIPSNYNSLHEPYVSQSIINDIATGNVNSNEQMLLDMQSQQMKQHQIEQQISQQQIDQHQNMMSPGRQQLTDFELNSTSNQQQMNQQANNQQQLMDQQQSHNQQQLMDQQQALSQQQSMGQQSLSQQQLMDQANSQQLMGQANSQQLMGQHQPISQQAIGISQPQQSRSQDVYNFLPNDEYDVNNYGSGLNDAFALPLPQDLSTDTIDFKKQNMDNYNARDFLPKEVNDEWFETDFSLAKYQLNDDKLINTEKYIIGINTVGQSLKNASYDIRGTIANPKFIVSPWNNSTYEPDFNLKPLC